MQEMTRIGAEKRKAAGLGAGGKLLALGRLLRMIAWNPLHALNTRAEEISGEMANIDFCLMVGTQRTTKKIHSQDEYEGPDIQQCEHHKMFSFPRPQGNGENRSTGIGIMVRNVIADSMHNIDHDAAKGHIKGRAAAAVRMASGVVDYDLGGLYFPPVGSLRRDKYQEVCTDIVKWFDKHLAKLPQRSVPLFAVDLNQEVPNPKEERVDPTVVGQHATAKSKNAVPQQLMQVMKAHGLCFLNTYHDSTATYYGNWNNQSRIDFLIGPYNMLPSFKKMHVSARIGRTLQCINSRAAKQT